MKVVGLNGRATEAIFKLLAAILHLGNLKFSQAKGDTSTLSKSCEQSFGVVCEFLAIEPDDLAQVLLPLTSKHHFN
jgi:myosin heavy subunit